MRKKRVGDRESEREIEQAERVEKKLSKECDK